MARKWLTIAEADEIAEAREFLAKHDWRRSNKGNLVRASPRCVLVVVERSDGFWGLYINKSRHNLFATEDEAKARADKIFRKAHGL